MGKKTIAVLASLAGLLGGCSDKRQPVACQDNPSEGEFCDPLPEGLYCRQGPCAGGSAKECRCQEGKWHCAVRSIDNLSAVPFDCGTQPLCRETCQWATVLPDGGLAFPTDGSYSVGMRYPASFSPMDMSTLWSGKGLEVTINGPVAESWLQDLAGRLSVCTWPEQEDVPATSTVVAPYSSQAGFVSLLPNSELADRWYALRLSALPFWMVPPAIHGTPDGAYVARFRTGSEPLVRAVQFAGGPDKHRLHIAISESVSTPQNAASFVEVQSAGASVACSDLFIASPTTSELYFDCPTLTTFPDQITIGAGLSSTTGVALAPVTIDKTGLTFTPCGTDCQSGFVP
jgi:hypothetical protein